MRNNPPADYAARRRFSGQGNGLNVNTSNNGNFGLQLQFHGAGQPIRTNPEYYQGQNSARQIDKESAPQDKLRKPLSFKEGDKPADQQALGFGVRKTPLSGTTLNVPAFKPKYRKASHDFVNDNSTNMFASEVFVRPSEKAKDNTPRAPTNQLGSLEGLARKVVAKDQGEPQSPLMKFKHTMLQTPAGDDDLSKSAILGLGSNDWKENTNNGAVKTTTKINNLDFFRHKPIIPTGDGPVNGGSPLLPVGYQPKKPPQTLPSSQSEQNSPIRIDLFKRRVVMQPEQQQPSYTQPSQPQEPVGVVSETSSPLRHALSFRRMDMRSNQSIPSEGSSPTRLRQSTQPPKLDDFIQGKKLGKGRFGDVFVVKHKLIGFVCAMKVISKQVVRQEKIEEQLTRELKLQSFMKHPNIAALYGCFDDSQNVYLLIELCADGHLQKILKEEKRLPEDRARELLLQICNGMDFLHREGVLHRDVKPQNIVMHEGMAKICDFGWAIHAGTGLRQTFCGTPLYVSPELLLGQQYDNSVDAWAVGVLAFEMLVGRTPFKVTSADDLGKIITDDLVFPSYVQLSPQAKDFLVRVLQKNPAERMDLDEMLAHPFLKEHKKELPQFEFKL